MTWLPKLVATDLDGTLCHGDGSVSEYTRATLAKARATGIEVVGVTGRSPSLIGQCLADIPAASHLVLAQGAYVVKGAEVLYSQWMDGTVLASLLTILEAELGPFGLMVEAEDGPGAPMWGEEHIVWPYPTPWQVRSREELLGHPARKAYLCSTVHSADEMLAAVLRLVPPGLCEVTQSGLHYVEICPPGVTKAVGLAVVAAALGVDPADVLVFGDMPNDVPMFNWAGHGVAVANAHDEVLTIADEVTLDNDSDGVAVYLDHLLA
jgi:Cof subfamily protein (haloacid dehalogenase superfamily)